VALIDFRLVVSPSPIGDSSQDVTRDLQTYSGQSLLSLMAGSGLEINKNCFVFIDGIRCQGHEVLTDGSTLLVRQKANEAITAAQVVAAIYSAIISYAISYAIGYLIKEFSGGGNDGNRARTTRKDTEGYGISGGTNQYRLMQPMPIVFGTHRVYPDFSQPWYVDYLTDAEPALVDPGDGKVYLNETSTPLYFDDPNQGPVLPLNPLGGWSLLAPYGSIIDPAGAPDPASSVLQTTWGGGIFQGNPSPGQYIYYGDNISSTYVDINGVTQTLPHRYITRVQLSSANFLDPFQNGYTYFSSSEIFGVLPYSALSPINYINIGYFNGASTTTGYVYAYGTKLDRSSQRLTAVYNFGFGDFRYSDFRIGQTKADDFQRLKIDEATQTPTSVYILQRFYAPNFGPSGTFDRYPTGVETVEGAKLQQYPDIEDFGNITRQSTVKDCRRIEWDIAGRLAKIDNGQSVNLLANFAFEYKQISSPVWIQISGGVYPVTNGQVFQQVRQTIGVDVPAGLYEARARKTTPDVTDSAEVCDINLERIKFFETDKIEAYQAQNLVGVQIIASSQINGALDRFSALVSAWTWKWVGGSVWDESYPSGGSPSWEWLPTSNPAMWYLNVLLGAYFNSAAYSGSTPGYRVGPHSSNKKLIYGYGMDFEAIDFEQIVRWSNYCDSNNLMLNAVLESPKNNMDLLIDIARVGRASPGWNFGKRSIVFFDKNDPVTSAYGMGNILAGSFNVSYKSIKSTDEIVLNFLDADDFYSTKQVRAKVPGAIGDTEVSTVTLWGVTSKSQAQREANLIAADQRFHSRTVSFSADIESTTLRRGDVIRNAHDLTSWAASGRVKDFSVALNGYTTIELDCAPEVAGQYLLIAPDGTTSLSSSLIVGQSFGSHYRADGSINQASAYPDSFPEDFRWHCGPGGGKKLRVLSVKPTSDKQVSITCTDEDARYYENELSPGFLPLYPEFNRPVIVKAEQIGVSKRDDGFYWLDFELIETPSAKLSIVYTVSGVPQAAVTAISGGQYRLDAKPSGTTVVVIIVPIEHVSNQSQSSSISFVYP
jgi:Putative phage tail protein